MLSFVGCNTTKFVPQGEYLLNKANIKVEDNKDVAISSLKNYLQQKQNTEILGFWKLQLGIYNTSPLDTTKWVSRNARKIGEAPVIYSPELTDRSIAQLHKAMQNKGYFRAQVDTTMRVKDRKIDITYHIQAGKPYTIRRYNVDFQQEELQQVAQNQRTALIREGMQFDVDMLNQERQRITSAMRRNGCFYFEEDYIRFIADSTRGREQVDLTVCMHDYFYQLTPEQQEQVFRHYKIAHVHFHIDYEIGRAPEGERMRASMKGDYEFTWVGDKLLRENVLIRNCPIQPGDMYNEARVERAYSSLNQLAPIKYVDISFDSISENELDCHIVLSRSKLNTVSVEAEGTYSAGDWGVAVGAGYANRNLFKGAEEFTIDGRTSYEWRQNGGRAIEAKASTGLKFPNSLAIDLNYNYQNRPEEYTRSIFGAGLQYQFRQRSLRLQHQFRFVDINYVYLPWISDAFRDQFLQSTNILKYSYESHFIVGWGYSGNYSSFNSRQPFRSYSNINYNVETAGNLMQGLAQICNFPTDEDGKYTLFNTRFAQFAKADVSFTYNQIFNESHRLVYHADFGVAVPYGNSQAVPFEKRYFAGGSNSVRGWTARSLGPGGYRGSGSLIDFNNQSGDIRMNLSMEYRAKVWSIIELAAFVDAGNIWTIFDYETQPHGQFRWKEFYKQIALAYGVGLRLDFSIFVFRIDFGVKLYDPSRLYDQWAGTQWRTVPNGLNWTEDMSFHFAIGYPF
ncbi:MAG: BamA/TamA family outer membrane protein [Paludibacteraceae bacterium]|nr:BamA/TamA family outer membrane protein [Paludibacteraceae bacterium]